MYILLCINFLLRRNKMEESNLQRLDRTGTITQQDLRPSYGMKQDNSTISKGTSYVKSANNSPNSSVDRKVISYFIIRKTIALSHTSLYLVIFVYLMLIYQNAFCKSNNSKCLSLYENYPLFQTTYYLVSLAHKTRYIGHFPSLEYKFQILKNKFSKNQSCKN